MTQSPRVGSIRALYWLPSDKRGRWRPLLPLRSVLGLLVLCAALFAVARLLEWELAFMAEHSLLSSPDWLKEDKQIRRQNAARITNSDSDPLIRTKGFIPPDVAPGRKRILVLGDSFVFGDGLVNLNMTFWRQLAWELEKRGYGPVDVIALGRNGASTQDEMGWLQNLKDNTPFQRYKPDLLIFGYVTNDPEMRDATGKPYISARAGDDVPFLIKRSWANKWLTPNIAGAIDERLVAKHMVKLKFADGNDEIRNKVELNERESAAWTLQLLEGENYDQFRQMLRRLGEILAASGVPACFVTLPNVPLTTEFFEKRYAKVSQDIPNLAGVPFYDLLPRLIEKFTADGTAIGSAQALLQANPANTHPGPALTRRYAECIADILESHYPHALAKGPTRHVGPTFNDWLPPALTITKTDERTWKLTGEFSQFDMHVMPMKKQHVICNFDRPASVYSLELKAAKQAHPACEVWVSLMDDKTGAQDTAPVFIGRTDRRIALPEALMGRTVTSVYLAPDSPEAFLDALKNGGIELSVGFAVQDAAL